MREAKEPWRERKGLEREREKEPWRERPCAALQILQMQMLIGSYRFYVVGHPL
jgi:hypothetical protein